jgi:hypothetical protein
MPSQRNTGKLWLFLIILLISVGVIFYYVINIFTILGKNQFDTHKDYTIDYSQGSGRIYIDFQIKYDSENSFLSKIVFQTTSTGDVEEIGISYFSFNVFVDVNFRSTEQENFIDPVTTYDYLFSISGIYKNNIILCEGYFDVKFNVNDVVQNETINFNLSIKMPIEPNQIFFESDLPAIWIEMILFISLAVIAIFISKTIKKLRYEIIYPEKHKKRDDEFWDYIRKKAEEQAQE